MFQEIRCGRELVLKPAISLKKGRGGATAGRVHSVGECEIYKEERDVLISGGEEIRRVYVTHGIVW